MSYDPDQEDPSNASVAAALITTGAVVTAVISLVSVPLAAATWLVLPGRYRWHYLWWFSLVSGVLAWAVFDDLEDPIHLYEP